jgi:hypothetical protein
METPSVAKVTEAGSNTASLETSIGRYEGRQMTLLLWAMLLQADRSFVPRGSGPPGGTEMSAADEMGTCDGPRGSVDLRRISFLRRPYAILPGMTGPIRISIDGENLLAKEVGRRSRQREFYDNIGYQVDENDDLDVELRLARVHGRLSVYWRETYRHRIYRQGLFEIHPDELFRDTSRALALICEGRGGARTEE